MSVQASPVPVTPPPLRLGTRASPLAMRQAEMTRDALLAAHGWAADRVVLVPMVASGDRIQDRALAEVGGKALWTRELDRALMEGEIDAAVHSMKDVETLRDPGFALVAMLERADVRDRLVGATSIDTLPQGARIGTSSPRRAAQMRRLRPDVAIVLLRGNVGTRLGKIERGEADATLLAAAGLDRLGMQGVGHAIPLDVMLPAPSQGAIGIEVRADDAQTKAIVSAINHAATMRCVLAERAFLSALDADCRSPVAAHASIDDAGTMLLRAEIHDEHGVHSVSGSIVVDGEAAPAALATTLLNGAPDSVRALFGG